MEIASKCLPVGTVPYDNIKHATMMMAKIFPQIPFLAILPNLSPEDTISKRLFENLPGIFYKDEKISINPGVPNYKENVTKLAEAFNDPNINNLEEYGFEADFLEKFFQIIKKFKSKNAVFNILGPISVSQILDDCAEQLVIFDKSYRKLFVQAICVKALWIIEKIKQVCPNTVPIIILEEPMLGQLGAIKKTNPQKDIDFLLELLKRVIKKLKKAGAIVGVQCFEKCDWSIPIKAGVDLISYDAYNNPNNLAIIPEILTNFLEQGGLINWGIVPVMSDNIVQGLRLDYLKKRLALTIEGVILSGVPRDLLYNASTVSLNGNTDKLSILFAEKAWMFASKLGSNLSNRF